MGKKNHQLNQTPGFRPGHEPRGETVKVILPKEPDVKIVQVTVFQPGAQPAIFEVAQIVKGAGRIVKINAGITDSVSKVAIEYESGNRTIFIGMPYTIWTEPISATHGAIEGAN